MTAFAHSVETLVKSDTNQKEITVSALVRAGLAQFINYPDLDHRLQAVDSETKQSVEANVTVSLEHTYTCMTCEGTIDAEERHVVISGVYSYCERTSEVYDHHHLHRTCYLENELPYWDDIFVRPMEKMRRAIVLGRIREIKNARKASAVAA